MMSRKHTPTALALLLLATAMAAGCTAPQRSSDGMARQRRASLPRVAPRETRANNHPATPAPAEAAAYTWQRRAAGGGEQLVVYGRGLDEARALRVGSRVLEARVEGGGQRVVAEYPKGIEGSQPLLIELAKRSLEVPEPFSSLKPDGLPKVVSHGFSRQMVRAPERVAQVGGKEVEALRIDLTVDGYQARNAPVTLFIGDRAIPHDQIEDGPERIVGWVYRVEGLRQGAPVTIDFGHGLRVLVVEAFETAR